MDCHIIAEYENLDIYTSYFYNHSSGCMATEKKYVSESDKQRYITFSSDGTPQSISLNQDKAESI